MKRRGFTLVELIVSVGLFMIVITVAMTSYVSLISLNRKARATSDVVSNLSFVIESMSRSIRTGTQYNCGSQGNCPSGANSFSYLNDSNQTVTYLLKSNGTIGECPPGTVPCLDATANTITDPRIQITNLTFYTQGVGTGDGVQPRVIFTVTGTITPDANSSPVTFTIESSATQRVIDI